MNKQTQTVQAAGSGVAHATSSLQGLLTHRMHDAAVVVDTAAGVAAVRTGVAAAVCIGAHVAVAVV